ncbi:hypothetical protein I545_1724 [Mycobacterium kansasii 662]|uniref:Uncharacterized protein n=2 Tax=Mycobacterium kansasii TaxID=1768 RepID=A0A1V3XLR1_MYCKA|nr:hypothetical protein I547_3489 [Mycobacterium kansasii 824]EUA20334.1 hypothetical protein I545_1724 [Mycobacterium kansasii 662]KEP39759.1 hypothetical protein MKSMC1_51090 [Mycobacterium kansasii]OOK80147.1 hypothetical protein BZL29_2644 [Mycobacterium kansasii]
MSCYHAHAPNSAEVAAGTGLAHCDIRLCWPCNIRISYLTTA